MGGAQVQSLTPTTPKHVGPLKGGGRGAGTKNTNRHLVPGLSFEGGFFNEQQRTFVPVWGKIRVATKSEMAAQILPSAQEKCGEKTEHFEFKHMGDWFSQPL